MKHNFKKIEPKWQKKWEEQQAFKAVDGSDKLKFYGLVEFHTQVVRECTSDILRHIPVSRYFPEREECRDTMYCSPSDSMHSDFLLRIMRLRRIHILVRSQTRTLRNSPIS